MSSWIALAVSAATLIVAIVGLAYAGRELKLQTRQEPLQLGNLYIERYWQIDDDLLITRKGTRKHRQHRHRYLRLFEDEFDAARLGWIAPDQWEAWNAVLDSESQRNLVTRDLREVSSDDHKFVLIRACLRQRKAEGRGHLPRQCWAMNPDEGVSPT